VAEREVLTLDTGAEISVTCRAETFPPPRNVGEGQGGGVDAKRVTKHRVSPISEQLF
jgi:hypothetical protein